MDGASGGRRATQPRRRTRSRPDHGAARSVGKRPLGISDQQAYPHAAFHAEHRWLRGITPPEEPVDAVDGQIQIGSKSFGYDRLDWSGRGRLTHNSVRMAERGTTTRCVLALAT